VKIKGPGKEERKGEMDRGKLKEESNGTRKWGKMGKLKEKGIGTRKSEKVRGK
jgi:hypothetical protein